MRGALIILGISIMRLEPFLKTSERVRTFLSTHRVGLATLVFTDLVGSTELKRILGDLQAVSLIQRHHSALREVLIDFSEAEEIETAGDSFFVIFSKPSEAVRFALLLQRRLRALSQEAGIQLQDRIGIHVGEVFVEERPEAQKRKDLFGIQVDTCARVSSLAAGDQILMTRFAFDNARQIMSGNEHLEGAPTLWLRHGFYEMKGLDEPLEICEVGEQGAAVLAPPSNAEKAKRLSSEQFNRVGWRPSVGQAFPNTEWIMQEKLGGGGFGEVWKAFNRRGTETSAFKFCFSEEGHHWLRQSWEVWQRLSCSVAKTQLGIVNIHEAYLQDQPYALRMEYLPAADLGLWCAARGGVRHVPLSVRVQVVIQLAEALQQAHICGVCHKDIKPSNIMVAATDEAGNIVVKLGDFGTWSEKPMSGGGAASSSRVIGSPLYFSPEQASGNLAITPASDIYSLGVVLYELLTGRPPFVRATLSAILDAHRHEDPRLPSLECPEVPEPLQRICLKAMEKRPQDRYASAEEVAFDLRRFTNGALVAVRPTQYDNLMATRARRHVEEIAIWRKEHLLTDHEFASLAGAYSRFDRAGLEAVMETRRVHICLLGLLLGGWLVVDGSALWLATQWSVLSSMHKTIIAWVPSLVTNLLSVLLWKKGRYRSAHILFVLGAISVPVGMGVTLHSLQISEVQFGNPSIKVGLIHNSQLLIALVSGVAWTALLIYRVRLVSVSAIGTALALMTYLVVLDFDNLAKLADGHLATLGLKLLPMAILALGVGAGLACVRLRKRQAIPWLAISLALLVISTLIMAWNAPEEWFFDTKDTKVSISSDAINPLRGLLIAGCALVFFLVGNLLRRWFLVSARPAYVTLLMLAPLCFLGGLTFISVNWPASWLSLPLFGERVALPDLLLCGFSIGCITLAASIQMRIYAFMGLFFLTIAEWRIGFLFFHSTNPKWSLLLLAFGGLLVITMAAFELGQRAHKERADIDDVAENLQGSFREPSPSFHEEDPLRRDS